MSSYLSTIAFEGQVPHPCLKTPVSNGFQPHPSRVVPIDRAKNVAGSYSGSFRGGMSYDSRDLHVIEMVTAGAQPQATTIGGKWVGEFGKRGKINCLVRKVDSEHETRPDFHSN